MRNLIWSTEDGKPLHPYNKVANYIGPGGQHGLKPVYLTKKRIKTLAKVIEG